MKNKTLSIIAVAMFPFVVISFSFRSGETNFILDENECNSMSEGLVYVEETPKVEVKVPDGEVPKESENAEPNYTLRVWKSGKVAEMSLEDYIIGVVAGEMPASFGMEALKAQAVAARTYALYRKKSSNGTYDVTSDTRTQMHITEAEMRKRWGNEYDKYYNRIKSAVESTKNEVITYKGEIIEAFYFALSSGKTENSSVIFDVERPYLKSVASLYDNSSIKGYQTTKTMSLDEFKNRAGVTCSVPKIDAIKYTENGYLEDITVCGKKIDGWNFRNIMGLKSSHVQVTIKEKVTFTVQGDGHCVGMSQYGANGYASIGYTYDEILKHYYTDVEITNLKNV